MLRDPLLRGGAYLFAFLLGMIASGPLPRPYADAVCLSAVLLLLAIEWLFYSEDRQCPISLVPKRQGLPALLLFPVFLALTLGVNLLAALVFPVSQAALTPVKPSLALFLGAVVLSPVTEELLFRGLLLRMLGRYGDGRAILLSSLAFALAHGNFFQMPYAMTAGLVLALAARLGGSVLYPYLFHLAYNLLTFFSGYFSSLRLLWIVSGLALLSLPILLFLFRNRRPERGERPKWKSAWLMLLYALETVYIAILNLS